MPGERLITRKAPEKVKQVIIRELQEFASRATYKGYGVFDVDALVFRLRVGTEDDRKALALLDQWFASHTDSLKLGEGYSLRCSYY